MLTLVDENSDILNIVTEEIDFVNNEIDLDQISNEMIQVMNESGGIGLAAPQIGLSLRIFVMRMDGVDTVCVNPIIHKESDEQTNAIEGCLSFPKLSLNIKRSSEIYITYYNIDGTKVTRWLNGINARCFLHEFDHLNGITFDKRSAKLSLKLALKKRAKLIRKNKEVL